MNDDIAIEDNYCFADCKIYLQRDNIDELMHEVLCNILLQH